MSLIADDLLEVELKSELELLENDDTNNYDPDIDICDIFSSNEGDYKLFELPDHHTTDNEEDENDNIWQSYFDKMKTEQQNYLNESQNILSKMKQTCTNTLELCVKATIETPKSSPSNPKQPELEIITTQMSDNPQFQPEDIEIEHKEDEEQDIITQDPHIPSHVKASPPLSPHKTQIVTSVNNHEEPSFIQQLVEDNIQTLCNSKSPSPSPSKFKSNENQKTGESGDDYQRELQKLENELREVTQAHEEELQMDTTVSWATLLQESQELYDEYIKTTEKIKRDKERLIIMQCFNGWKSEWDKTKREKLRIIKVIIISCIYLVCYEINA